MLYRARAMTMTLMLAVGLICGPAALEGASSSQAIDVTIQGLDLSSTAIAQGDVVNISMRFDADRALDQVTAVYVVQDRLGHDLAYLESDFFEMTSGTDQIHSVDFKWTDFHPGRTGELILTEAFLKHYPDDMRASTTVAQYTAGLDLQVSAIDDPLLRLYIARENALWWLTQMGWVDSPLARANGLDGCVIYGGWVTGELTNEEFYADGSDIPCYWEISGYAVRFLAREYERTAEVRYLQLARRTADAIVRNMADGRDQPSADGSLHTMDYFNGTEVEEYLGQAVMFDHAQILMGLMELARVLQNEGTSDWMTYQAAGERIAAFMHRAFEANGQVLPESVLRATLDPLGASSNPMAVLGMDELARRSDDGRYARLVERELDRLAETTPTPFEDYHGQSYFAYGMLAGFDWLGKPVYLEKAAEFARAVSRDLSLSGKLRTDEYSRIPAQSQIVWNNTLLWTYTGDEEFLRWADLSAHYLINGEDIWVYNQPILKLGRYYRESGGQYNYGQTPELTAWGTEFFIEALYHYLHHRYGDIYIDPVRNVTKSTIATPEVTIGSRQITVTVAGRSEGVHVYVRSPFPIESVQLDGEPVYAFDATTARVPPYEGEKTITVMFGEPLVPHVTRSSSLIRSTQLADNGNLVIRLTGKPNTQGAAEVFWPAADLRVTLNGQALDEGPDWTSSNAIGGRVVRVTYPHDGTEQILVLSSSSEGP